MIRSWRLVTAVLLVAFASGRGVQLTAAEEKASASNDEPVTTAEVVTWMSERLGAPTPPPAETRRANKRCRNARLGGSGYVFQYPTFRDGYPEIIRKFLSTSDAPGPVPSRSDE